MSNLLSLPGDVRLIMSNGNIKNISELTIVSDLTLIAGSGQIPSATSSPLSLSSPLTIISVSRQSSYKASWEQILIQEGEDKSEHFIF